MYDVVCGQRPLLHGLKEAPESFRMVIPFTGANLVTRRATETVAEVILLFYCTSSSRWLSRAVRIYSAQSYLLSICVFYLTGCCLHCRQALLLRGRKTAPDDKFSGAAPDNSTAPAHGWILKLPFQAILPIRRTCTYTEADPDDPGLNPRKWTAALRAQPKPYHTSTAAAPVLRYRSLSRQKRGDIGLCAGETCISVGLLG